MSRLPETDQGLVRKLRQRDRDTVRQDNASPFSRSGLSVTAEGAITSAGTIQSVDYDGTARPDLGTSGWALARDGAGSYLVLDGVDVRADLDAKDAAILGLIDSLEMTQNDLIATVDALADTQADLATTTTYLASLVTRDATLAGFNTGTLTNDGVVRYVGGTASVSIDCPTGKLRVIVSCPEASVTTGTGSGAVIAYISFSVGAEVGMGTYTARLYTAGTRIGASLTRVKTITVPPGTYAVSGQAGYWCSGYSAASIQFADLDLSVEVVNGA